MREMEKNDEFNEPINKRTSFSHKLGMASQGEDVFFFYFILLSVGRKRREEKKIHYTMCKMKNGEEKKMNGNHNSIFEINQEVCTRLSHELEVIIKFIGWMC